MTSLKPPLSALSRPLVLAGLNKGSMRRISASLRVSGNRNMGGRPKSQLWSPNVGIRFSPAVSNAPLYPSIDTARFLHQSTSPGDVKLDGSDDATTITPKAAGSQTSAARDTTTPVPAKAKVPTTPLTFNMSDRLFHLARVCEPGSPQSFWSHTMYEQENKDGSIDKVKVHYCTSKHTMEQICKKHFVGEPVLGFDLEWMAYAPRSAGPREAVSLIQLASPGRIGLFHIALFAKDDYIGPVFRSIMEDAKVSKVGVNISGDCTRLKNKLGVDTKGIFELSHLYKLVQYLASGKRHLINRVPVALATQIQDVMGLPMYKGPSVRESNWMKPLNEKQLRYSASDAYAGIQLYHVLDSRRQNMDPCPDRPYHLETGRPIPLPDLPSGSESDIFDSDDSVKIPRRLRTASPNTDTQDSRITAADELAIGYRSNQDNGNVRTPRAALRSYYMWHNNNDLQPTAMAAMLRSPPLKTTTVTSYILDSIIAENLPYNSHRLREEVMAELDIEVAQGPKYATLYAACQPDCHISAETSI